MRILTGCACSRDIHVPLLHQIHCEDVVCEERLDGAQQAVQVEVCYGRPHPVPQLCQQQAVTNRVGLIEVFALDGKELEFDIGSSSCQEIGQLPVVLAVSQGHLDEVTVLGTLHTKTWQACRTRV